MATWCFKTAMRHTRETHTYQWYWQLDTDNSVLLTSMRLFDTLEECVANAQERGFRGALQVPVDLTYPAVLTWTEGAPLRGSGRSPTSGGRQVA
jgi:hypothetical protein